ncbi:MAG TPA: hypothetical protein DDZ41_02305 [Flavobacterium sp.]|nr:hypothetical protein [Flavobacterium sp.]
MLFCYSNNHLHLIYWLSFYLFSFQFFYEYFLQWNHLFGFFLFSEKVLSFFSLLVPVVVASANMLKPVPNY